MFRLGSSVRDPSLGDFRLEYSTLEFLLEALFLNFRVGCVVGELRLGNFRSRPFASDPSLGNFRLGLLALSLSLDNVCSGNLMLERSNGSFARQLSIRTWWLGSFIWTLSFCIFALDLSLDLFALEDSCGIVRFI